MRESTWARKEKNEKNEKKHLLTADHLQVEHSSPAAAATAAASGKEEDGDSREAAGVAPREGDAAAEEAADGEEAPVRESPPLPPPSKLMPAPLAKTCPKMPMSRRFFQGSSKRSAARTDTERSAPTKSTAWAAVAAAAAAVARASASALAAAAPVTSEPLADRGGPAGEGDVAAEAGREGDEDAIAPLPWRWSVGPHARIPKPRSPPPTPPRKKRSLIEEEEEEEEEVAADEVVLRPAAPAPPPPPPQGSKTPASAVSSKHTFSETLLNRLKATCCLKWRTRLLLLLLLLLEEEPLLRPELDASAAPTPATSSDTLAAAPSSRHPSPRVPPNLLVYLRADFSEFPACALTEAEARRVASASERQASS